MSSFKITLSYDGTDFVGWQRQSEGASIQGLLEDALRDLDNGREIVVIGAGRTDAGVHALGQVASFSLNREIDGSRLRQALNARLPPEVRVLSAEAAPESFQARFDARAKVYRYCIWNGEVMSPFDRRYAWHLAGTLDREAMQAAASLLEGRRDFAAFQAAGGDTRTTERELFRSRIDCHSDPALHASRITYEVEGDGFLRHMVRNIVGSLVEVARGRHSAEWMSELLEGRDRNRAGPTAPAHGLALVSVSYGDAALAAKR